MNTDQLVAKLKQYPLAVGCVILAVIAAASIFIRGGRMDTLVAEYDDLKARSELMSANLKNAIDLGG